MKAVVLAVLILGIVNTSTAGEIDCSGVKIDANFGAQQARSNMTLDDALVAFDGYVKFVDEKLVQTKRPPLSRMTKERMKQAFRAGYSEAIKQPDQTTEQIAGQVAFACITSKYK